MSLTVDRPASSTQISLIEEFLLLTLEDSGGEFDSVPEIYLNCGIAGAALMDLALRGRIDADLGGVFAVDATPTGDASLDLALAEIVAEQRRLGAQEWITRLSRHAPAMRKAALSALCARGILRQSHHAFLWVLKERRYPVVEGQERPEAKKRILALLYNDDIPSPADVALTSLADASFVFERILTPKELERVKPRIRQIARMDLIGGEIARTAHEVNLETRAAERRTVIAGLAGNVMEWYDFGVYGFFAAAIGTQFFPSHDPSTSLIASFGVFAVGFIARPLGGLLFGHIGDRLGRRAAVVSSVILMIIPTLLMALLPTYQQIGIAAPALLILLRLAQGLAVGGEYTTSMVLLVEEAQARRRGLVGSFAPFGALGGLLLGSAVGATLMAFLPQQAAASWGWRLAFFTGLLIGLVVFVIRRRLPPDQAIVQTEEARKSPLTDAFRTQWRTILKVVGFTLGNGVGFYLCFVYVSTWLKEQHHLSASMALTINSIALFLMLIITPLAGALSDRIGRKPVLMIGAAGLALFAWPIFRLMSVPHVGAMLAGQCAFALFMSCYGASPAFLVEAFPKHVRCSGLSIGYNLALSVFGGTVPMVAVFLIKVTGYALAPAFYLTLAALISLAMAILIGADAEAEDAS
ncbi:MAG: MFS transporter [Hyphomicrobiales bacterium]|nr:MAG: MFS transporter [Hyphomicrobiales bacterium]